MSGISQKNFSIEGLVIGRRDFFEADHLIEIFSLEKGKISAIVKGAKRTKSKLGGSTELFTYGQFGLAKGKSIDIITSAKIQKTFFQATQDLEKISHFFLICEVLNRFLPRDVPNKQLFQETLAAFSALDRKDDPFLVYKYIYKLVILLGHGPSLEHCPICHEQTKNTNLLFNYKSGGILCEACLKNDSTQSSHLSKDTIKILKYIETENIERYSKLKLEYETGEDFSSFVESYLSYVYQREFNSSGFIKKIKLLREQENKYKISQYE